MANENIYFRGADLGEAWEDYTYGTSAGAMVLPRKRRYGDRFLIEADKIIPTSPPQTTITCGVLTHAVTGSAATMAAVKAKADLYVGKIGVLKFGSETISTEAYCTYVGLKADHPKGYIIAYSFTCIKGTGMTHFSNLQNGGFEAVGDDGAIAMWTAVPGTGTIAMHELTGADEFGSGQFCIKWTYGSTQSNATHFYQPLSIPLDDETTDTLYTRVSIDAFFESQTTIAKTSAISVEFNMRPTGDAFDIADRLYSNEFTLYSNQTQRLNIAAQTGFLTAYTGYMLSVCITGVAAGTEGDVIYFDNATVEEIHNLDLI